MDSTTSKQGYKIVLLGEGGVGKTTWVNRYYCGDFTLKYTPTLGVNVTSLSFNTNRGKLNVNVWDTAGQKKYGGMREGYWIGSDACIVFFDVTNSLSYVNADKWIREFKKVNPNAPIVLVGNKVDLRDREVLPQHISLHEKYGIQYYDISCKSNYNYEKPFLYLLRMLQEDQSLCFTDIE